MQITIHKKYKLKDKALWSMVYEVNKITFFIIAVLI